MSRPKRTLSAFSLSFLDIMSCGFGAAVLLFLIIKHKVDTPEPIPLTSKDQTSEVMLLEEEILTGKKNLAALRNTLEAIEEEMITAQGRARQVSSEIREVAMHTQAIEPDAVAAELEALKTRIKKLEQQKNSIAAENSKTGEQALKISGEGNRQYITGLRLDGRRSLILLDISASMLDRTVVNILRFRNLRDERKRLAHKWQQAIKIVEWLMANLPADSQYQLYLFNTDTLSALPDSKGRWLDVDDKTTLQKVIERLKRQVPENGTNLENAFIVARQLRPAPDNIYLITDGLPTQGSRTYRGATITANQRQKLFERAIQKLPDRLPINVILTPMEGDLQAAFAFWQLSQRTNGAFISPQEGWP